MDESREYSESIMEACRGSLGLDEKDTSQDDEIKATGRREIFRMYCQWNGLLGMWSDALLDVAEDIFDVSLDD